MFDHPVFDQTRRTFVLLQSHIFKVRMESQQKKMLSIFASILIFALFISTLRLNAPQRLKAPEVYGKTKPNPPSILCDDELVDMRKSAIRSLFTSRNTLSFCKHTSNKKSKGDHKYIKSQGTH